LSCVVKVEGAIARISGGSIGIYVSRRHQHRLARFHGRRVTVLVIIDDCVESCRSENA
jgi:hypothetical protein